MGEERDEPDDDAEAIRAGMLAAANLAIATLMEHQHNRLALDLEHLLWLGPLIEADFRFLRRQKWLMRGVVFWNIAAGCACLASWPRPVALLVVLSVYGAWKGFCVAEGWADDERRLGARWAVVREKIKALEGMTNES